MPDEEQSVDEQQEQTQPEVQEQPQEEKQEATVEPQTQQKRKDAEYNFAELRRQREEDRRRAEEAERRANELLELLKRQTDGKAPQKDHDEDELERLSQDDLLTVKHADKKINKRTQGLQQELQTLRSQLAEMSFRQKYPDIDEVLSLENIEMLKKEDPDISEMISRLPAGSKEQITLAYKYIKKMAPIKVEDSMEKKKAIENSKKPLSVQAVTKQSAIGNAHHFENGLSKELREQLYREMKQAQKG